MKLQCPCGAKYAFEISPEMLQNPVKFVCPSCGLDSSAYVNELIRQEFSGPTAEATSTPQPPTPTPPPPPPVGPSHLRIAREEPPAEPQSEAPAAEYCPKHRNEIATEKCVVCQKPICPKCMELFGYFCSPLCKNRAEQRNIKAPVYAGRRDLVEARSWRNIGLISSAIAVLVVLFLGAWIWYDWFGSVPHPYLSVKFPQDSRAYAGSSQLVGNDQFVFLHGGTLARYDLKTGKKVWSKDLISKQELDAAIKQENEFEDEMNSGGGYHHRRPATEIDHSAKLMVQSELKLLVDHQNIWVAKGNTLTHYDWNTGKAVRKITLPENISEMRRKGDELLMAGDHSITHVSLVNGKSHVEQFGGPGGTLLASAQGGPGGMATSGNPKPLNPQKVQTQVQNMTLPGRMALPALLANEQYEKRIEAELNDNLQHSHRKISLQQQLPRNLSRIVPGASGFAQFEVHLLKTHFVTHEAIKAPSKNSVVNGNLTASQTGAAANEILNNIQRTQGTDKVTENDSSYRVTVHLPESKGTPDWTGEVVGPPQLFVLKSVNVITAGKQVIVLDKSNKKLWQAELTYRVPTVPQEFSGVPPKFGAGPCVEHGHTLYVFDKAVLTAFDLHSGKARWRLPSVGTVGLFFDNKDDIYVNTTTGNPDNIKYSRQIDINQKIEAVLFKIDAKTGKVLWHVKPGGYISYLSGPYIYTMQSYDPHPLDGEDLGSGLTKIIQRKPYLRIARIQPSDGHLMWEYEQDHCPVDAQFHQNSIQLIFKGKVQVLRYITL